ncbi:MAG: CocE/NonD family hydrolase, partial [Myxococcota bacterium]|nr:CocE/NonD family hydrolase [Myxococcota bacterium]
MAPLASTSASAQVSVSLFASDDVELATDFYMTTFEPQPVLLIRTRDGRELLASLAWSLVDRYDVKVVVQDIRGHGDSGGEDPLFATAVSDGMATLDWIDTLGWSNGIVGAYGRGLDGLEELLLATSGTSDLSCLYLSHVSGDLPHAGIFEGGLRRTEFDVWATAQGAGWVLGEWDQHPSATDPYWEPLRLSSEDAERATSPGLHVTGWYDVLLKGAIGTYQRLQTEGGVGAAGRQRLVIGPWNHRGATAAIAFPDAHNSEALFEWDKAWASDCLHADPEAFDALPAALVYLMGADEPDAPGNLWMTVDGWPPPSAAVSLYLRNKQRLTLELPLPSELGQVYGYEPTDPPGTLGGRNLRLASGPEDQSPIEERDDVAVYTSEVLKDPVTILGDVSARLWILTDWDVTDVVVRLTDVYPDGRSMLVAQGVRRISAMAEAQLVEVDLWSTGMVFNVGHQLRVSVAGAMNGAYEPAPERFSAFILNSESQASSIILPVVSG